MNVFCYLYTAPKYSIGYPQVDEDARCLVLSSTPLGTSGRPACCGFGTPCNQAQGGAYAPDEAPLCRWSDGDRDACIVQPPVLATVCPSSTPCPRFLELQAWVAQATGAWERSIATQTLQANTMVFNAFIFMQARHYHKNTHKKSTHIAYSLKYSPGYDRCST